MTGRPGDGECAPFFARYVGLTTDDQLGDALSFDVDWSMPQRKLVDLGKAISRIVTMEMTIEMGERGFSSELVSNMLDETRAEVRSLLETYRSGGRTAVVEEAGAPDWLARARTAS